MKMNWSDRQNILCVRPDNMGDLLMSSPAIRAIKESFRSSITVLTSSMAGHIAKHIPNIDKVIIADVPWVKSNNNEGAADFIQLVEKIRKQKFDAAVIFTVFSQNPLPSVMLAYLAGIPFRLAYCRENPYDLLTHWVPDKEPYTLLNHQVQRDLQLVSFVGASTNDESLALNIPNHAYSQLPEKIKSTGVNLNKPWIIVHPGASEIKRQYPLERFNIILKKILEQSDLQIVITGSKHEKALTENLRSGLNGRVFSVAGLLSLDEFMALVDIAPLVLSVNTGTVHIAAALQTPVIVLYALTNPQHTPWNVTHDVFPFPVEDYLKSRNEILKYVDEQVLVKCDYPDPDEVVNSVMKLMRTVHPRHA